MVSDRMQNTYDPRYDGIYQRGAAEAASRAVPPAPHAPALPRPAEDAAAPSVIREVGSEAPGQPEPSTPPRNPFDVWAWVVAALLVALGVYFLSAPMMYEQQYVEQSAQGQMGTPYSNPWFNYTVAAAPPLIFLGVATAVVQLFVLSIRHTLRTR
ncbi:hypothetical protein [Arthrobacter sedimenti]|uniref:hypothetical protein n=1 Tax=Arthrobacter sedimenti TaxID=2694931 RepID=UPI000B353B44|nr:hypothetical protein [Arthrobacter sedimenti]OUM40990.1 hypothetical protein B8W73_11525 [Arthrobacter agilis]